ncbi:MAG: glycosyltransferase family 4 protein [Candidatus Hodarchaeota archaeon]
MNNTICITIQTLEKGGAEKQSMLLAKQLQENYKTILVVLRGELIDTKNYEYVLNNGITIILLKGNILKRSILFYNLIKKENVTVLFTYLTSANIFGALISKIAKVKYVFSGIRNSQLPLIKSTLQKIITNYFTYGTIINNHTGSAYFSEKGFNRNKIHVVHNGIEILLNNIVRNDNEEITILTVARFVEQKNWMLALRSIKYLCELLLNSKYKIKYSIVGYGEEEDNIRQNIIRYGLTSYADIFINPDCIENYYLNSDIYLSTSYFEGLSNTIMEAMNYSLPIVASNVGDNKYLIKNGESGVLIDSYNHKEYGRALYDLVVDYNKRTHQGNNSYLILKEKFSAKILQQKYISIIENLDA